MMEFQDQGDVIAVFDYSYGNSQDMLYGVIKKVIDDNYHFFTS